MFTVREFVHQMYRLISAANPTIPLHGDDEKLAIRVLNQILQSYASSGLMLTIAKTVTIPVDIGIKDVIFCDKNYQNITVQNEAVTLTSGSPNFMVANGAIYEPGEVLSGTGIPPFTTIVDVVANVVTMSADATASGLVGVTFTRDVSDLTAVYIREGRLANMDSAWLLLNGVTYPLIQASRDEFLAAWKYEPLQSLPRFIISYPETNLVRAQLYPAPSQFYQFYCRGKFQLSTLTVNDDMSVVPEYWHLYFMYAVAKYVSKFKGRSSAWTDELEAEYRELKDNMEGASEINLSIVGDRGSLLNGAHRVRAGI